MTALERLFRRRRPSGPVLPAVLAMAAVAVVLPARADGDPEKGRKIAEQHCSRCHVVGTYNALGGANNTASFQMIIKMADGVERFQTFFARPPHPVFTRVPGVARRSNAPPYASEFTIEPDEVEHILAFAKTLRNIPIRRKGDRP